MFAAKTACLLLIKLFLQTSLFAQIVSTDYHVQAESVANYALPIFEERKETLFDIDSASFYHIVDNIQKLAGANRKYAKTWSLCQQAINYYHVNNPAGLGKVSQLMERALQEAYNQNNEQLISYVSWAYGALMYTYQQIELSVTYCLQALERNNDFFQLKYGYAYSGFIGEMLYHSRDYEKCIYYERIAVTSCTDTSLPSRYYLVRHWNTIGQAYQKLGQLDSALVNYKRSMRIANDLNTIIWQALNAGCMGQVFFLQGRFDLAKPFLKYDYDINRNYEKYVAAYSLQWAAKLDLIQGQKDSALAHIKEALLLLSQPGGYALQRTNYQQYVYYTTSDVYRELGRMDSFYHYFQLYAFLHDSLEKVATSSSTKIARLRIDNEQYYQTIKSLKQKQTVQQLTRNLVIGAIVVLFVFIILLVNRQLIKQKNGRQLALQEKAIAELEVQSAKQQLTLITQNIIAKTELIEKLEQQLHHNEMNSEKLQLITEVSQQTILTDEDWEKFKNIFEKIYPGFFMKVREKAPGITPAEQRMAALTRLQLTGREMANMLGISLHSVQKTRQRLRHRMGLSNDDNLEDAVHSG